MQAQGVAAQGLLLPPQRARLLLVIGDGFQHPQRPPLLAQRRGVGHMGAGLAQRIEPCEAFALFAQGLLEGRAALGQAALFVDELAQQGEIAIAGLQLLEALALLQAKGAGLAIEVRAGGVLLGGHARQLAGGCARSANPLHQRLDLPGPLDQGRLDRNLRQQRLRLGALRLGLAVALLRPCRALQRLAQPRGIARWRDRQIGLLGQRLLLRLDLAQQGGQAFQAFDAGAGLAALATLLRQLRQPRFVLRDSVIEPLPATGAQLIVADGLLGGLIAVAGLIEGARLRFVGREDPVRTFLDIAAQPGQAPDAGRSRHEARSHFAARLHQFLRALAQALRIQAEGVDEDLTGHLA